jgi:hypothetical protein
MKILYISIFHENDSWWHTLLQDPSIGTINTPYNKFM